MKINPYRRKVNFYETDQMGVVHHSNYIRWFEEARVDFMEQIGYSYMKANEIGIDFAVLKVVCEYKSMVRFGDTIDIHLSVASLTPVRMSLEYKVMRGDEVCTVGESEHCGFHTQKKKVVSIKREMPELYELFLNLNANAK